jgi:small-conductance mechanosensitive channel
LSFFERVASFLTGTIVIGGKVLPFTPLALFLEFLLPVILVFVFYRIALLIIRRFLKSSEISEETGLSEETKEKIIRWIKIIFRIFFLILVAVLLSRLFGAEILSYLGTIFSFLNEPFFESGATRISVITLVLAIPIFYFATWTSRAARRMIESSPFIRDNLDPSRRFTLVSLFRYGILTLVIIIGLSIIGINLSSLAVIFGVLGIGLGFGLQGVVANFFAGLVIIFTKPIKEGDRIYVNNVDGTVVSIRLISTIINTLTNESIIVPNSQIISSSVHNYSYADRMIAVVTKVQVSYSSDLDKVLQILMDLGHENPFRDKSRNPRAMVESFDDSGITVSLWTWVSDVSDKLDAKSWANLETWRRFKEMSVEIPFPQLDLHVKNIPDAREHRNS